MKVGARVTISQRVHLCAGAHDYRMRDFPLLKTPLVIGNDSWVCADAFVGPNVVIQNAVVVGACSVVMKDCEEISVYAGNPAVKIKSRKLPSNDN